MGARQRSQKRGKAGKKASTGSLKGSPISQKKSSSSLYVADLSPAARNNALLGWNDFAKSSGSATRKGFSMSEEARNTERHVLGWGPTKLREQGISFVSAGTLHRDEAEQENDHQQGSESERDEPEQSTDIDEVHDDTVSSKHDENTDVTTPMQEPTQYSENDETILAETIREDPVAQIPINLTRAGSESSSCSDDEQIVFRGRQPASQNPSKAPSRSLSHAAEPTNEQKSDSIVGHSIVKPVLTLPIPIVQPRRSDALAIESSPSLQRTVNPRLRRRGRTRPQEESDEEEAIMQDYIANMAMDDSGEDEYKTSLPVRKNEHFRYYDGSGNENAKVQVQSAISSTPASVRSARAFEQALDWDSGDLEDFDDFSTTDEEITEIAQVLRQRHRPSGLQYLVTPKDHISSDAKWMSHKSLVSPSAQREIRIFEEIQAMQFEEGSVDDESSTDDEDEEALKDLIDTIESEDDENTKIMQHMAMMTDEQVARALAKQEELGLGGDELLLFNGDVGEDDEGDNMDAFGRNDDFVSFSLKQHTSNRGRSKRNKKQRDSFPSAAAFADALDEDPYGAFDVMDFDRPSLRPKKKGRKSDFPYDLDHVDEELRDHLTTTWMKDREKKASRKRQKEEERLNAVLDASERSEPGAIKAEIRRFLVQEIEVLRLAPMDSHVRASVHRLAKALRLNSHSEGKEGSGAGRYPVLTKTIRTPTYTIDTIWEVDALMNTRKFFPKFAGSYKSPKVPRGTTARVRRSGGVQGASYMNGEVVGASAPELGADNKGRLLLEKMGWSTGMGIGAIGNKGSLEAIKHVVKTTKAGLG